MPNVRPALACLSALVLTVGLTATAQAHPHVFVDAKAELVFDGAGNITAVRNIWRFDEAYSAFASQGLDTDGDGKLSAKELAPLAKLNVDSMVDYAYFTFITSVDGKDIDFKKPTQRLLDKLTVAEAKKYLAEGQFPAGSMGPKIEAAIDFIEHGGKEVIITQPFLLEEAIAGRNGTHLVP